MPDLGQAILVVQRQKMQKIAKQNVNFSRWEMEYANTPKEAYCFPCCGSAAFEQLFDSYVCAVNTYDHI